MKIKIGHVITLTAVVFALITGSLPADAQNSGSATEKEIAAIDYFNALTKLGIASRLENSGNLIYHIGDIMWIYRELTPGSDLSANPPAGVWKNVPIITASGDKLFSDIYFENGRIRNYDGFSLNLAYLDHLLSIDGISIHKSQAKQQASETTETASAVQAAVPTNTQTEAFEVKFSTDGKESYTGVIVDATGIGAKSANKPNIVLKSGKVFHGYDNAMNTYMEIGGAEVIRYYKSVADAKMQKTFVGNKPLMIKAVGTDGKMKSDIVISDEDAARIRKADKDGKFLRFNRVALIIGD